MWLCASAGGARPSSGTLRSRLPRGPPGFQRHVFPLERYIEWRVALLRGRCGRRADVEGAPACFQRARAGQLGVRTRLDGHRDCNSQAVRRQLYFIVPCLSFNSEILLHVLWEYFIDAIKSGQTYSLCIRETPNSCNYSLDLYWIAVQVWILVIYVLEWL